MGSFKVVKAYSWRGQKYAAGAVLKDLPPDLEKRLTGLKYIVPEGAAEPVKTDVNLKKQ
jgi:hypothetical protein